MPDATPLQVWTVCVWQSSPPAPQCCSSSFHASRAAGSAASCQSRALPEKESGSPTAQVVPAAGVAIVATGGAPAVTVTVVVPCRPPLSVTRRPTVTTPGVV